jgi:magnesium transporter
MENTQRLGETVRDLVESGRHERLGQVLEEAHAADIAAVLRDLSVADRVTVFRLLTRDQAGEVLAELDDPTLSELAQALDPAELSGMLDRLPPDDAAQVLEELPAEQSEQVLDLMKEEKSEDVQELLDHGEKTAGRIMSPDVLFVHENLSVGQAIEQVRKSPVAETAQALYVVDDHEHLVGSLPWRRLITADPATPVGLLREEETISVRPETDQEEVAQLVAKYDVVSIPVVDQDHRLIGTISVDDVIDVIQEEHEEDVTAMVGSGAEELERLSTSRRVLLRLPWLMITIVIQLLGGLIIARFSRTLSQVILLVSFMPVIQAISGNTGLQSATIVVRGLATGHMHLSQWRQAVVQQLRTTLQLGLICGAVVGTVGALAHGTLTFGIIVGLSMLISVNLSAIAGTGFPMLSKRLGFDPALTAGPFETAFQDVVGVSIYLGLATALIRFLL